MNAVLSPTSWPFRRPFGTVSPRWRKRSYNFFHSRIRITRDVRYSDDHPRNVLDIYEPQLSREGQSSDRQQCGTIRPTTVLFVHGGMWMRGSKEQNTLSPWNVAHSALTGLFGQNGKSTDATMAKKHASGVSNVGLAVSAHGGVALIINYRLSGEKYARMAMLENMPTANENNIGTRPAEGPRQVMDVARAIAFSVERELAARQAGHNIGNHSPNIFVCGHSAGAHLAALALSHPYYIRTAMEERGIDINMADVVIAGFIGISGVYNLRRLGQSAWKDIIIGPAFLQGHVSHHSRSDDRDTEDILTEFSPVHALLRAHAVEENMEARSPQGQCPVMPPLAKIPILLLNAESDFHLEQDTKELKVALGQFSGNGEQEVETATIMSSDHLKIMSEFGSDIVLENVTSDATGIVHRKQVRWSFVENMFGSQNAKAAQYAASAFGIFNNECDGDETSRRVLEFVNLTKKH